MFTFVTHKVETLEETIDLVFSKFEITRPKFQCREAEDIMPRARNK
jgi:hypothetical protein